MQNKNNYWLIFFILIKCIMQLVLSGGDAYDLQRDEYLHLDQGKHLAWGFHSVPPFTSWMSWIILHLGGSVFMVRLIPALFGVFTLITVWKTAEALGGKRYALILAATALVFSTLLRLNLLFQPNAPEIFFFTFVFFTLVKYVQTSASKWLYFGALAIGLGLLNKYNIMFCMAGLLPALLFTPQRHFFMNKHFYFALLLAFAIVLPNLIWQYSNGFPVISHMKELRETQLDKIPRMEFVKEQVNLFFSALPLLIAAFVALFAYEPFKPYRFAILAYIFTMALFIMMRAKGYYAFGMYPIFFAFGAVYLEAYLSNGWKRYFRIPLVLLLLILFIPVLMSAFPIKTPEQFFSDAATGAPFSDHTWEDGKKHPISQDFADMLGWRELASKVDKVYASLPDKENTIIIANNYGQAGAINYYSKFSNINAVSFNADYVNWFKLNAPIHNVIRIVTADSNISDMEKAAFETVTQSGSITNRFAREYDTKIYLLKGAKGNINSFLKKKIEELK